MSKSINAVWNVMNRYDKGHKPDANHEVGIGIWLLFA